MNTAKLARSTFVLDRSTDRDLSRIARKFGVSRSSLVRGVLAEPVAMMAAWVDRLPANMTEADRAAMQAGMLAELEALVDREMETVRHG